MATALLMGSPASPKLFQRPETLPNLPLSSPGFHRHGDRTCAISAYRISPSFVGTGGPVAGNRSQQMTAVRPGEIERL